MLRCRPDGGAMSHVDVCHDLGCDVAMSLRAGAMSHVRLGPERMSRGWVGHIARHRNIAPATSCATSHKACAMSLLRPRARGDRATSQTAWATSQHRPRDTGAHRGRGGHGGFFSDRSATPHEQRRERHRVRPGRCRYIAPGAGAMWRCGPGRVRCRYFASGP